MNAVEYSPFHPVIDMAKSGCGCEHGEACEMDLMKSVPDDKSLPVLQKLLKQGYTDMRFIATDVACKICRDKNNTKLTLKTLIRESKTRRGHDAPVYWITHPNCKCVLELTGKGKPTMLTDFTGATLSKYHVTAKLNIAKNGKRLKTFRDIKVKRGAR